MVGWGGLRCERIVALHRRQPPLTQGAIGSFSPASNVKNCLSLEYPPGGRDVEGVTMRPTVAELVHECGGLDQVLNDLASIRRSQKAFSGQHRQLSREHPNQWVAFHDGELAALGDSLDGVLKAADEKTIPRGKMVIRYQVHEPTPEPKAPIHVLQGVGRARSGVFGDELVAELIDLTAGSSEPEEEAVIPLAEFAGEVPRTLQVGSVFPWIIGYEDNSDPTNPVSRFVFCKPHVFAPEDLERGRAWPVEMGREFNLCRESGKLPTGMRCRDNEPRHADETEVHK